MAKRVLIACAAAIASVRGIQVGDVLPQANLDQGFLGSEGKKIPGYLAKQAELKAEGIDDIIVFAVNDGAVMTAWAQDQKTEGSMIQLLGDTRMELTKALGLTLNHPGPMGVLGNNRCQRFSMYINNCKIKTFNLAAAQDDPAGDDRPEVSMAEKMLEDLKDLRKKDEL